MTVFTFFQLHPGLIFGPNDDVGGDNAAHIAAASFFIHHLLPHFQLSGWDPQWFGGFPLYVFYFPLPAIFIALFNAVFGFAVAFKIVTILGTLLMPTAAYVFGRCAGFARPVPALMSVAMLPFLFNVSYTIDGGNIASTLAGEFSFTLAVAFGLMFLGVLSYALRSGRLRWLAAALFTATILCHVVPAIVVGIASLLMLLTHGVTRRSLHTTVGIGVIGALLAAFWLFRFGANLDYTSSMGYDKVTDPFGPGGLFPHSGELAVQVLALVGAIIGIWVLHRVALVLVGIAIGSAAAFVMLPSGLVYNGRWLPFWFLATSLLAAYALGAIGSFLFRAGHGVALNEWLTPTVAGVAAILVVAGYLGSLPGQAAASAANFIPAWTSWNYSGYQAKSGWPEFQRVVTMLDGVGAKYGCGNLDYEYSPNVNTYFGSTIVEMSFPYWTHGCVDSAEGLYYESSSSTPFHFLDQSEVSIQPSNPIPGLPYQGLDVADGIRHLQLTGVKYFLANSPTVEAQAAKIPDLTEIASTPATPSEIDGVTSAAPGPANPRWVVYSIAHSDLVEPLQYNPVVETLSKSAALKIALIWYQTEQDWPIPIARSGPANWAHVRPGTLVSTSGARSLPTNTVTGTTTTIDSITFSVAKTGLPVVVKVPYFPNWKAHGATGPFPVTPNLMVVVPTAHHVTLTYGTTSVDWVGRVGSLVGLVGLVALGRSVDPGPFPGATMSTRAPARTPLPEPPESRGQESSKDTDSEADDDRGDRDPRGDPDHPEMTPDHEAGNAGPVSWPSSDVRPPEPE
ncbi:MAG TPA: 6-pyruvoyl-tetrahydropterin synthase-related protein [Acidimicrobiales bacterium]|nr:6-pyruvoyl-tetrahydropterin synthase-related protein [Acidimicrobiales bacterium]